MRRTLRMISIVTAKDALALLEGAAQSSLNSPVENYRSSNYGWKASDVIGLGTPKNALVYQTSLRWCLVQGNVF